VAVVDVPSGPAIYAGRSRPSVAPDTFSGHDERRAVAHQVEEVVKPLLSVRPGPSVQLSLEASVPLRLRRLGLLPDVRDQRRSRSMPCAAGVLLAGLADVEPVGVDEEIRRVGVEALDVVPGRVRGGRVLRGRTRVRAALELRSGMRAHECFGPGDVCYALPVCGSCDPSREASADVCGAGQTCWGGGAVRGAGVIPRRP